MVLAGVAVALAGGIAIGVVALTSGGDGPVALTAAQTRTALLDAHEVGAGYGRDGYADGSFLELTTGGPIDNELIDATPTCLDALDLAASGNPSLALDRLTVAIANGGHSRLFSGDDDRADVAHAVDGSDHSYLADIREVLATCEEMVFGGDGVELRVRLSDGAAVDLGDDAIAYSLSLTLDLSGVAEGLHRRDDPDLAELMAPTTFVVRHVVWTRRGITSMVATMDVISGPGTTTTVDPDQVGELAEVADAKLVEVLDEAG